MMDFGIIIQLNANPVFTLANIALVQEQIVVNVELLLIEYQQLIVHVLIIIMKLPLNVLSAIINAVTV
jgi:hypothetical protein